MPAPAAETEAYLLLERLRWGAGGPVCPHCGSIGRSYFLRPADAAGRRTRTGRTSPRRVWKCGACRRQFSALTGTIFEGSRVGVRVWLGAASSPEPASPARLAAEYGISAEAARTVVRRLRLALETAPWPEVVRLPADEAARIRGATPGRRRARRQVGPTADYGAD